MIDEEKYSKMLSNKYFQRVSFIIIVLGWFFCLCLLAETINWQEQNTLGVMVNSPIFSEINLCFANLINVFLLIVVHHYNCKKDKFGLKRYDLLFDSKQRKLMVGLNVIGLVFAFFAPIISFDGFLKAGGWDIRIVVYFVGVVFWFIINMNEVSNGEDWMGEVDKFLGSKFK